MFAIKFTVLGSRHSIMEQLPLPTLRAVGFVIPADQAARRLVIVDEPMKHNPGDPPRQLNSRSVPTRVIAGISS